MIAYVKFNLDLLAGVRVHQARFRMYNFLSATCTPHDMSVFRVADDWNQQDLTWNNQPWLDPNPVATTNATYNSAYSNECPPVPEADGLTYTSWDVHGLVDGWLNRGVPNYGMGITTWETANGQPASIWSWKSYNSQDVGFGPRLTFTYSPYRATISNASDLVAPSRSAQGRQQVTIRNDFFWTWPTNRYYLSYHLFDNSTGSSLPQYNPGEPRVLTPFPHDIAWNETITLTGMIEPLAPGKFGIAWDIVVDPHGPGRTWFRDEGNLTAPTVLFDVGNAPPIIRALSPSGQTKTNTPTLQVTADDAGDNWPGLPLYYRFWTCYVFCGASPWQTSSTYTTTFPWGTPYTAWYVDVQEGPNPGQYATTRSQWMPFTPTMVQPSLPAHLGADPYGPSETGANLAVGNYSQTFTDARWSGAGPPLTMTRTYNSLDGQFHAFGLHWSNPYELSVTNEPSTNTVLVRFADGHEERFGRNSADSYASAPGRLNVLTGAAGGGWVLIGRDGTRHVFDSSGKLTSVTDGGGHAVVLDYVNNRLSSITAMPAPGRPGRKIWIHWAGTIPDRIDKVWTDGVLGQGPSEWLYTYTGFELTSVCGPRSTSECTRYEYGTTGGSSGRMTRIKLPRGNDQAVLDYNADGTIRSRRDGSGAQWNYTDDRANQEGLYHPLSGGQVFAGDLTHHVTRNVTVAGMAGIPSTGVQAVALNITVHNAPTSGVLEVFPSDRPTTGTSTLNVNPGETLDELHVVAPGADGKIGLRLWIPGASTARVTIAASGWYGQANVPGGSSYHPIAGARLIDSRAASQIGPYNTRWENGTSRPVTIAGTIAIPGIPKTGVTAVAVNITTVEASGPGALWAYATGDAATPPAGGAATAQMRPSQHARSNHVIVKVGTDGTINLKAVGASAHVVVDVSGWYSDAGSSLDGAVFRPLTGARVLQSRFSSMERRLVSVTGVAGIPTTNVVAAMGDLETVNATGVTTLLQWAADVNQPNTLAVAGGNANSWASNALPGALLSQDGKITVQASGQATDILLDIFGYFVLPERKVTVTTPRGKASSYVYDRQARIVRHTDELGNARTYEYDTAGFLYKTTDETGRTVVTTHDLRGNVRSRTNNDDHLYPDSDRTTYYKYFLGAAGDPRNDRVIEMRDARTTPGTDGAAPTDNRFLTTYTYNADGTLATVTTPATSDFPTGRTSRISYTTGSEPAVGGGTAPPGLKASEQDPTGVATTYSYASNGDLRSRKDPDGLVTEWTYDELGRPLTATEKSRTRSPPASRPPSRTTSSTACSPRPIRRRPMRSRARPTSGGRPTPTTPTATATAKRSPTSTAGTPPAGR